jgi:hypothetical protein
MFWSTHTSLKWLHPVKRHPLAGLFDMDYAKLIVGFE